MIIDLECEIDESYIKLNHDGIKFDIHIDTVNGLFTVLGKTYKLTQVKEG